jgi:hypothetical protein
VFVYFRAAFPGGIKSATSQRLSLPGLCLLRHCSCDELRCRISALFSLPTRIFLHANCDSCLMWIRLRCSAFYIKYIRSTASAIGDKVLIYCLQPHFIFLHFAGSKFAEKASRVMFNCHIVIHTRLTVNVRSYSMFLYASQTLISNLLIMSIPLAA